MSDTTEITRRSRADRPARQVHRDDAPERPSVTVEGMEQQVSPEDALANSRQQLTAKDQQIARERQQRVDAERRAAAAESTGATARQTVLGSLVETAKAEQAQARAAMKAAREAGDVDAEADAVEALSSATGRLGQAAGELEWLKTQPKPQPTPNTNGQANGPSAAAQRWLDEHPRYQTDVDYKRYANGLHNEAVSERNLQAGTQEYIDFIERGMTDHYGEGHGHGEQGRQQMREAPSRGDTVPASRGGGGGGSASSAGWKTVRIPLGHNGSMAEVLYQDRSDGSRGIKFKRLEDQANFKEGARTVYPRLYEKDENLALAEYTQEQIQMNLEGYQDEQGPYMKTGDGQTFGRGEDR